MVLVRVEDQEPRWPGRSAVVACACVCRCWRAAVKEIVRVPEASGKLTFPISLKQPGPRDAPLKCFIRRNRAAQSYSMCLGVTDGMLFSPPMYAMPVGQNTGVDVIIVDVALFSLSLLLCRLADDGKFLLAARKCRRPACTEYLISLDAKNTSAGSYIGKLRSNFLGTKFTVYDAHPPCARAAVSKGYMIPSTLCQSCGFKGVHDRLSPSFSWGTCWELSGFSHFLLGDFEF
ncbi:hypothetical protein Zm00014a_038603 [Zea mays]|uniref:Tubby-like F-box protein 6 n=2 Tax=Zea mays TaxID=4577 RepID=A0A3L6G336_MAIZE|nr:Tubby-like F-box protein 6 [Zea mays]PWZ41154.1 hypothetical protein Zm00014a_038603 [Zea mays]